MRAGLKEARKGQGSLEGPLTSPDLKKTNVHYALKEFAFLVEEKGREQVTNPETRCFQILTNALKKNKVRHKLVRKGWGRLLGLGETP
jgi:hypothetical protein